jgi:hypothetical protein
MKFQHLLAGCFLAVATTHAGNDYRFTVAEARKAVLAYCQSGCVRTWHEPHLPCCDKFEEAMAGDFTALTTVFTDLSYQSADDEAWSFTAWPLIHVVGDKRFAAYLRTLDAKAQKEVFDQISYGGSEYPEAIKSGYFRRKFPEASAIYRRLAQARQRRTQKN